MPSQFNDRLNTKLRQGVGGIVDEIKNELREQGHMNTGELYKSVGGSISQIPDGAVVNIEMNDYHVYVEKGVRAGRIRYSGAKAKGAKPKGAKPSRHIQGLIQFFRNRGSGKKEAKGAKPSRYIQGLIEFFINKGLSENEAKGAAFATAKTHAREGMPTSGSYRFSKNGRRLKFIDESTRASAQIDDLEKEIQNAWEDECNVLLDDFERKIK